MPTIDRQYQPVGPLLVRASTHPRTVEPPPLPDLTDPAATVRRRLGWLATQWSRPDVREALMMASPSLAARVHKLLPADDAEPPAKTVDRAVLATASYLARWQRRATPFGLFAGVTTATVGSAAAKIGDAHQAITRADADWLARVIDRLEQHHDLRRRLMVVTNSGGFVRDGRFIVAALPQRGERTPGPVRETSTRYTRPVQMALTCAAQPVRFDWLAEQLAIQLPHVHHDRIEAMLQALVDGHFLITNLRPPMTAVDGLTHVIEALRAADCEGLPDVAVLAGQLADVQAHLLRHNSAPDYQDQATIRSAVVDSMAGIIPATEYPLAVDVRLDAEIRIPQRVLDEAAVALGFCCG